MKKIKSLSWKDAEKLVREGRAATLREFSARQTALLASPKLPLTQNLNKLFYLVRQPWTNGDISGFAISYYHPIYIVADQGRFILKMDKGTVSKVRHPGTPEYKHVKYLQRISNRNIHGASFSRFAVPYTPESVQSRIKYLERQKNATGSTQCV